MKTTIIGSLIYGVLFAALTTVADAKPNTPKFWALLGISAAMVINEMWQKQIKLIFYRYFPIFIPLLLDFQWQ